MKFVYQQAKQKNKRQVQQSEVAQPKEAEPEVAKQPWVETQTEEPEQLQPINRKSIDEEKNLLSITKKELFMSNSQNKQALIMLCDKLKDNNIRCFIKADIIKAGEEVLTCLYGGLPLEGLDILLWRKFKSIVITGNTLVQVKSLPPTSDSGQLHSLQCIIRRS
ncbi:unnamed protein product [Mytilus edulis]|uniref:Uncharacterized protein n=1 Tax=Mytilus edulis TaxID=6550 RepID=A0A8S3S2H6_MYTED|nr:unnamed protein product [Mytilus edulis]